MTFIQALLLGAVQGATEFLPVSSSGHLAVLRAVMELRDVPVLFDVMLHIATLIVVIVVFRRRVGGLLRSIFRWVSRRSGDADRENLRLAWVIIVATVLTGVIGLAVGSLETGLRPRVVSALFILTGLILLGSRFFSGSRDYRGIGLRDGVIVGIAQGLGVFPGISRSGITISAGLVAGMDRETAGEFAFLVSIPAILGAFVLTLRDAAELSQSVAPAVLVAGFVAALVVGAGALTLLLRIVKSGRLYFFAFYLIPLGIAGLVFL